MQDTECVFETVPGKELVVGHDSFLTHEGSVAAVFDVLRFQHTSTPSFLELLMRRLSRRARRENRHRNDKCGRSKDASGCSEQGRIVLREYQLIHLWCSHGTSITAARSPPVEDKAIVEVGKSVRTVLTRRALLRDKSRQPVVAFVERIHATREAAEAVAVFETILTMCILGLLGSSSWIDCQLYLTLSLLPEMVAGVCGCDERIDVGRDGGVIGLSFLRCGRLHTGAADAGLVSSAADAVVGPYIMSIVSVCIVVGHDLNMLQWCEAMQCDTSCLANLTAATTVLLDTDKPCKQQQDAR
ncbi:hypothetical protein KCU78_g31, partial [Aureobasidium melanogenum]